MWWYCGRWHCMCGNIVFNGLGHVVSEFAYGGLSSIWHMLCREILLFELKLFWYVHCFVFTFILLLLFFCSVPFAELWIILAFVVIRLWSNFTNLHILSNLMCNVTGFVWGHSLHIECCFEVSVSCGISIMFSRFAILINCHCHILGILYRRLRCR